MCHAAENYTGTNFTAKWANVTLGDLYQDISLAMPPANPGGLTPASYASILAFFLEASGYPEGRAELPGDRFQLGNVSIGAAPQR